MEIVASVMMTDLWLFHKTYDERECDALLDFVVVLIGVIVTYMRCVEEYKFVMVEVFAKQHLENIVVLAFNGVYCILDAPQV